MEVRKSLFTILGLFLIMGVGMKFGLLGAVIVIIIPLIIITLLNK